MTKLGPTHVLADARVCHDEHDFTLENRPSIHNGVALWRYVNATHVDERVTRRYLTARFAFRLSLAVLVLFLAAAWVAIYAGHPAPISQPTETSPSIFE